MVVTDPVAALPAGSVAVPPALDQVKFDAAFPDAFPLGLVVIVSV